MWINFLLTDCRYFFFAWKITFFCLSWMAESTFFESLILCLRQVYSIEKEVGKRSWVWVSFYLCNGKAHEVFFWNFHIRIKALSSMFSFFCSIVFFVLVPCLHSFFCFKQSCSSLCLLDFPKKQKGSVIWLFVTTFFSCFNLKHTNRASPMEKKKRTLLFFSAKRWWMCNFFFGLLLYKIMELEFDCFFLLLIFIKI